MQDEEEETQYVDNYFEFFFLINEGRKKGWKIM